MNSFLEHFPRLTARARDERWTPRLFAKDASLWSDDSRIQSTILRRLGWLSAPEWMDQNIPEIRARLAPLRERFEDCVVLGMGGSSLCAEVLSSVFERPRCRILDTTDPDAIRALETELSSGRTLFVVASKSGTTVEVEAFHRYFADRASPDAFLCITDPRTPLAGRFQDAFLNPPDVGGRFSALSFFGMVPFAWMDGPLDELARSTRAMRDACMRADPDENPGAELGLFMASAALAGKNKLCFVSGSRMRPLGAWIEQLVAESTGKSGVGVLPVPCDAPPAHFGSDRAYVFVDVDPWPGLDAPTHVIRTTSSIDLGGEFFRWQTAVSFCAIALGINPFDEPDVNDSKARTRAYLDRDPGFAEQIRGLREIATPAPDIDRFLEEALPGEFLGLLLYLPPSPALDRALASWTRAWEQKLEVPFTVGYGPRYLHSTGQFHKGGPNQGRFLHVACANEELAIPGWSFGFGALKLAQAMGDYQALVHRGRNVRHVFFDRPADALDYFTRR